jgi:polysaccharide pyruvyl transferase CsaB
VTAGSTVGICGSYGGLNLGDEAILTTALEQLSASLGDPRVVVFTRNVGHTEGHHRVDRVVDAREALRDELAEEVGRLDLLLLGGGGLLYDREAERYLHLLRIAQAQGVPTATFAIGAGPLDDHGGRRAVAEVLNGMALVTVRDVRTRRLLEEIGVDREITVTADPALLLAGPLRPLQVRRRGGARRRHLVGMSVREPGAAAAGLEQGTYHRLLAHAADFVAARYGAELLFFPMESQDIGHAHRVICEMGLPDRATVVTGIEEPMQLLRSLGRLDLAIGMRLHFVMLAALAGVPVVGLPYAPKVSSFLDRLGVRVPEPVQSDRAGALLAAIDRTWDTRAKQSRLLGARITELQQQARRTAPLVAELLTREARRATLRPA